MSHWDLQPKCTAPAAAEQVSEFYASEAWPSLEPSLGNSGTYGELRPHGVRQLLDFMASFAPLTSEDIFADLGSGRGGVLVQVVLDTPMRAIGVELSEKRANTAKRVADRLERSDRQRLTTLHGDFLKVDAWLNATLVYVNSAAFSVPLLFKLRSALQRLQPGSLALTVRRLPGCTRGLWPVGTISLPFNWARDVKMHAYMVAPGLNMATIQSWHGYLRMPDLNRSWTGKRCGGCAELPALSCRHGLLPGLKDQEIPKRSMCSLQRVVHGGNFMPSMSWNGAVQKLMPSPALRSQKA